MRVGLFLGFILAIVIVACGSAPVCTGNGNSTNCTGNGGGGGGGPSPGPSVNAIHVDNWSFVGQYLAGNGGNVTCAFILANLTYGEDGQVGNGAGRIFSCANHITTYAVKYHDWFRPDSSCAGGKCPGLVMQSDSNFQEGCGTGAAWFQHGPTGGACNPSTRATPIACSNPPNACVNVTNFVNSATSTFWKAAVGGNVNPADSGAVTFNGLSPTPGPGLGDPNPGLTLDTGDFTLSDTSAIDLSSLTGGIAPTFEIADNPTLVSNLNTWNTAALQHQSGLAYGTFFNGLARGINKSTTNGKGSCKFAGSVAGDGSPGSINCLTLSGLVNSVGGDLEFYCQNVIAGKVQYQGEFCPWYVNSAATVIASGKDVINFSEYESNTPPQNGNQVGTTGNLMLLYYAAHLLTYQTTAPHAEISALDVEAHVSAGGQGGTSSFLATWPVQQIVPVGTMAIGVTTYATGAGPTYGIDGCANGVGPGGETDSGGIIPYFVTGSCGTADDTVLGIGVYANASSACNVAGTPIGPCAWFINPRAAAYTIPCAAITTLGTDLSLTWGVGTFTHWAGIGQIPDPNGGGGHNGASGVLGDLTAAGGGSMTTADSTNAVFTCGSATVGVLAADSGGILLP